MILLVHEHFQPTLNDAKTCQATPRMRPSRYRLGLSDCRFRCAFLKVEDIQHLLTFCRHHDHMRHSSDFHMKGDATILTADFGTSPPE